MSYNSFAVIITWMGNLIHKGVKKLAHFRVVGEPPFIGGFLGHSCEKLGSFQAHLFNRP